MLLGLGVDPLDALSEEARRVWRQLDGLGVTVATSAARGDDLRDIDGSYADWFAELGATVVLVRPDFQVYGASADAAQADALVLDLGTHLHLRALVPALV